MRVVAIGDAHLGRSYYPFTTPEGINQREWDFERSFEAELYFYSKIFGFSLPEVVDPVEIWNLPTNRAQG